MSSDDIGDREGVVAADGSATELWSSRDWLRTATRWIDANLERRGVTRVPTSPLQPRLRPWSTLLVADTDHGRVWFKACAPQLRTEVPVVDVLADVAPDLVPPLWASDRERGWMLVPDQGPILRDVADADTVTSLMSAALRRYARAQRASAKAVDQLIAAGVPRLAPSDLVDTWTEEGLSAEAVPALRAAASRLEEVGLPLTIQHDDLHAGNVFAADASSASMHDAKIFDWGDAYVGNPLCSLLIPLRGPSYHFDLADDPERDARMVRAYLTCWSDLASSSQLNKVLTDALLLARVGRIAGWRRALANATVAEKQEWSHHPMQWVREVTELTR